MSNPTPSPNQSPLKQLIDRIDILLFALQQLAGHPLFLFCLAYIFLLLVGFQISPDFIEKLGNILIILPCLAIVAFLIQHKALRDDNGTSGLVKGEGSPSVPNKTFYLKKSQELINDAQKFGESSILEENKKALVENVLNLVDVTHFLRNELNIDLEKLNVLPKLRSDNHALAGLLIDLADSWSSILLHYNFWDELTDLSKSAYIASLSLNRYKDAAKRAGDMAWITYCQGETPKMQMWLSNFSEIQSRIRDQGLPQNKDLNAKNLELQGLLLYRQSDQSNYQDAIRCLQAAYDLYEELNYVSCCISVLNMIGYIEDRWHGKNAAFAYYNRALILAEQSESTRLSRGECYKNLGQIATTEVDASTYYEKALGIAKEFDLIDLEVSVRTSMLFLYEKSLNYKDAYLQGRQVLKILKKNKQIKKRYPSLDEDYVLGLADKLIDFSNSKK